jgi:hypothetical protein
MKLMSPKSRAKVPRTSSFYSTNKLEEYFHRCAHPLSF